MSTSPYNVLGIGQPLIDRVIKVDEETLEKLGITEKGGSSLLNQASLEALLKSVEQEEKSLKQKPTQQEDLEIDDEHFIRAKPAPRFKTTIVPGGSCANTIKGLAGLGEKCALIGKIGKDEMGQLYKDQLSKAGVIPLMTESPSSRTGEVVCLITPDGQRTMRAFLGASDEMHEKDLLPSDFKDIKLFHVEGYAIYNLPLMIKAMQYAKQHGALISYDLGSFEVVRRFKSNLVQNILKEYVDIVFANEEEAKQLTSPEGDAEDAVEYLADLCHVAVVMMGPKGCWVKSQSIKYRCRIDPVTALDTTGAGDCFASAFLYAYLQGYTVEQCARLGSLAGKAVVQVIGAGLTTEQWKKIKQSVNDEQLLNNSGKSEKQHSSSVPKNMGIRKQPAFFHDDDSSLSSSFSSTTSSFLSSRPTGAIAITKK